jgi:hypothetical protein
MIFRQIFKFHLLLLASLLRILPIFFIICTCVVIRYSTGNVYNITHRPHWHEMDRLIFRNCRLKEILPVRILNTFSITLAQWPLKHDLSPLEHYRLRSFYFSLIVIGCSLTSNKLRNPFLFFSLFFISFAQHTDT